MNAQLAPTGGIESTAAAEEIVQIGDLRVSLLDLSPAHEPLYPGFLAAVSLEDRRLRLFTAAPVSERQVRRFTHYDPAEAAAIAAIGTADGCLYGVARLHRTEPRVGEFAVIVRTDLKGHGLGRVLMERIIARAPGLRIGTVFGLVLRENAGMLALARELGFGLQPAEPGLVRASLRLPGPSMAER